MSGLKKFIFGLFIITAMMVPECADASLVDSLDLAPFVPLVLKSMMGIAVASYDFFVGENGAGIINVLIFAFVGLTVVLYLVKMYIPKNWLANFGFSGGGEIVGGNTDAWKITENVLKPVTRALIALVFLLQIKPVFVTEWLAEPFLRLGAIYTEHVLDGMHNPGTTVNTPTCDDELLGSGWISQESCNFLLQPVSYLSAENNRIIKRGLRLIKNGLRDLMVIVAADGADFLNVITGIILVITFVSSNIFMALLIIQGIFDFGVQLILYPFYVLTYVTKPSDKWFDVWPAFDGIVKSLKTLVVTMIACAFILCINIAVIKALFHRHASVYSVAAGGSASSNVPYAEAVSGFSGFGDHSVTWLSAILTFYLFFRIFDITQQQLMKYVGSGQDALYKDVKSYASGLWQRGKSIGKTATGLFGKK